jgi:hypothetical protein
MKKSNTLQGLVITIFFLLAGVFTAKGQPIKPIRKKYSKKMNRWNGTWRMDTNKRRSFGMDIGGENEILQCIWR